MQVIALSGSLRKDSYNTKLLKAFKQYAPDGVTVNIYDVTNLPLLNEDLESDMPESVKALHAAIEQADAALFATPEYNRSYSPVLKNAIDWGSRPDGENSWEHMPAGVVGCTPYNLGAFGAQHHLRQVLVYLDMPTLAQPEFYLEQAGSKFDESGQLTDAHTKEKIQQFWTTFITWAEKNKR